MQIPEKHAGGEDEVEGMSMLLTAYNRLRGAMAVAGWVFGSRSGSLAWVVGALWKPQRSTFGCRAVLRTLALRYHGRARPTRYLNSPACYNDP